MQQPQEIVVGDAVIYGATKNATEHNAEQEWSKEVNDKRQIDCGFFPVLFQVPLALNECKKFI